MRIAGGVAVAVGVVSTLSTRDAAANGRYPASTAVVLSTSASDPALVVVRATYGLLVSHDGGSTWRWLCESALGVPTISVEDPALALTAGDAFVVGHAGGLEVSHDDGCNFACAGGPLAAQSIVDVAVRPDAPHAVVALASSYVFTDGGGSVAYDTRVWQSADDGTSWTQLGVSLDPTVAVTTLDVAPSDPQRLYVSGTRGYGSTRSASLFVSTNGGASWTERPLPFDPATEVQIFIGAVDPGSADRVYVRSSGVSRLFVTNDAGRTFRTPLALTGEMLGFAIAPDGGSIYAGSIEDGLFASSAAAAASADAGSAFQKIASIHVQCLATHGSDLWACSDVESGFVVGVSTDGGAFAPRLRGGELAGPIVCAPGADGAQGPYACGADANASQCSGGAFASLCATLDGCSADAGTGASTLGGLPDAATTAVVLPFHASSCGCSMAPRDTSCARIAIGIIAIALARRRRRRSDTSGRPRARAHFTR